MGLGSSLKSELTKRKRPALSVINICPSGKKATDQGFSRPVSKVLTRKACFSELMTKERSCAQVLRQVKEHNKSKKSVRKGLNVMS
jgi:hypothetical protein